MKAGRRTLMSKKGSRGFKELMYKGKPVKKSGQYTKVDLILCKDQPEDGSHFRLDMRYKVNKVFCSKHFCESLLEELALVVEK